MLQCEEDKERKRCFTFFKQIRKFLLEWRAIIWNEFDDIYKSTERGGGFGQGYAFRYYSVRPSFVRGIG